MARKFFSGILMMVGFILSPLSWWNDLIVNIPLAYLGGSFAGFFNKAWFFPGMVVSYWLTNVLGFLLMHWSYFGLKRDNEIKPASKKDILNFFIVSFLYTALIVVLMKFGILKFPAEYFQ